MSEMAFKVLAMVDMVLIAVLMVIDLLRKR